MSLSEVTHALVDKLMRAECGNCSDVKCVSNGNARVMTEDFRRYEQMRTVARKWTSQRDTPFEPVIRRVRYSSPTIRTSPSATCSAVYAQHTPPPTPTRLNGRVASSLLVVATSSRRLPTGAFTELTVTTQKVKKVKVMYSSY